MPTRSSPKWSTTLQLERRFFFLGFPRCSQAVCGGQGSGLVFAGVGAAGILLLVHWFIVGDRRKPILPGNLGLFFFFFTIFFLPSLLPPVKVLAVTQGRES